MSYIFLAASGEESSAECFSDIPASVLSRLNLTAEKSCSSGNETASCPDSPSGMTLRRSTDDRGEERLMWYAGDFPVRTYLPLEKARAFEANAADCGPSSPGSLAKFNPDLYGWKTAQCSLFGGLEWFAETWPRWGMIHDGELFPLPTLAHLICGNESGFSGHWPTPTVSDVMGTTEFHPRKESKPETNHAITLAQKVQWSNASQLHACQETGEATEKPNSKNFWPTPRSSIGMTFTMESVRNQIHTTGYHANLEEAVALEQKSVPTPSATDWKGSARNGQRRGQLTDPLMGVIAPGGQLNPPWVEWVMGWPIGWTDLKPLEMAKFRQWLDSHGER